MKVQVLPGAGIANAEAVQSGKADMGFSTPRERPGAAGHRRAVPALRQRDRLTVMLEVATATVGVICLAGGPHEYFFLARARPWERLTVLAAALVLIEPDWLSDLAGVALLALTRASQRWLGARAPRNAKEPA